MDLLKFLLSILTFMVVVLTLTMVIPDMNENYAGVDGYNVMDSKINDSVFNKINDTYNQASSTKEKVLGEEVSEVGTWETMVTGAYGAVRFVTASFEITGGMIDNIATELGLASDSYLRVAAKIAILLFISFSLIYLLFRFKS